MPEAKHIELAARLEQDIRAGRFGEKLPPVRQLAADFKVALQTMSKALKPLREQGLLDPGPGGTRIVLEMPRRSGMGVVTAFILGKPEIDPAVDPLLVTLREAAEADGITLVVMWVEGDEIFRKETFWKAGQTDGYIFLYSSFYPMLSRHLHINGIPFVVANWLPDSANAHWVDFDWRKRLFDLVRQLREHGYQRIAYLPHVRWQEGASFHLDLWRDVCAYYEMTNYSPDLAYFGGGPLAVSKRWYEEHATDYPEVIIPSNTDLRQLLEQLAGWKTDTRVLVQCHGKLPDARCLSCGSNDYQALGKLVWKVYREVSNGTAGPPHPHFAPGTVKIDWSMESK